MFSNGNRREVCFAYSSCVYWHASERASFLTDSCDAATGLLKLEPIVPDRSDFTAGRRERGKVVE